jgi:hypothetical protein
MMSKRNDPECAEVLGHLPLFVGGDLVASGTLEPSEGVAEPGSGSDASLAIGQAVERHLGRCEACRRELERAREARSVLLGMRAKPQPDVDLWPGIRAGLVASGLIREPAAATARFPPWVPYAAAAGLLGGLVSLGLLIPRDSSQHVDTPAVAGNGGPGDATAEAELAPAPVLAGAGQLRLADPGEERMANTARPFPEIQVYRPARNGPHALATDTDKGWR